MTKLVAGRLKAQAVAGPHPEPESLSAFAENALSEAERGPLLQHLGACSDCREILYLAAPDLPEMQKALVPRPRPFTFRRWIFGWGALAASLAIMAVFFTTNRHEHKIELARMVAPAPAPTPAYVSNAMNVPALANENETKIAAGKAPQELDQLQAARAPMQRDSVKPKTAADLEASESTPQPEAKHMTAKPQASLDFDQSGQVRVSAPKNPAPQSADEIAAVSSTGSQIENLHTQGQNMGAPAALTGAASSPAPLPQTINGIVAGKNAVGYASSRPDLAKKLAAGLGGTILDPSGAVVANAKVTVVGPSGEKVAISDPAGRFSFDPLLPGSYSLKAEAPGFKATEIKRVAVLDDKPAALNLRLAVGTVSEVVEVANAAPAIAETRGAAMDAAGTSSGYVARQQASQDSGVTQANVANVQPAANARLSDKDAKVMSGTGSPALQWTISPEGAIQHSADGGKTWQPASVPGGATFRALSAVGGNIWVGGNAGALYHSADFGQSWVKCEPAAGDKKLNQDIVRMDFSDALNGTVNAANGGVWSTSDGGKTWLVK